MWVVPDEVIALSPDAPEFSDSHVERDAGARRRSASGPDAVTRYGYEIQPDGTRERQTVG